MSAHVYQPLPGEDALRRRITQERTSTPEAHRTAIGWPLPPRWRGNQAHLAPIDYPYGDEARSRKSGGGAAYTGEQVLAFEQELFERRLR